jgi:type IV conjugative transfer system protein TraE
MNFKKYVSTASNLFVENRFAKLVIVVMALIIFGQMYMLNNAYRENNVYLVPPGLEGKVRVAGSHLDPVYLQSMGMYVSQLMYSFIPQDVIGKYEEVSSLFVPELYQVNKAELLKIAAEYKDNDVSTSMKVLEIKSLLNPNIIEVKGRVEKYIADTRTDTESVTLRIHYTVQNGTFRITALEQGR